jgi:hypothetical protein
MKRPAVMRVFIVASRFCKPIAPKSRESTVMLSSGLGPRPRQHPNRLDGLPVTMHNSRRVLSSITLAILLAPVTSRAQAPAGAPPPPPRREAGEFA